MSCCQDSVATSKIHVWPGLKTPSARRPPMLRRLERALSLRPGELRRGVLLFGPSADATDGRLPTDYLPALTNGMVADPQFLDVDGRTGGHVASR